VEQISRMGYSQSAFALQREVVKPSKKKTDINPFKTLDKAFNRTQRK
jgi:hypothetical protein